MSAGSQLIVRDRKDAFSLLDFPDEELLALADSARRRRSGNGLDLCSIVNARSGACPEDCTFCAQSAGSRAGAKVYPLVSKEVVRDAACEARKNGARRFCVVTSGRSVSDKDIHRLARLIGVVSECGLKPCATLGIMNRDALGELKAAGLHRYHHNLETSEAFFPNICGSHSYQDKINTIHAAAEEGLSICSGGLFGMGESWEDRVDMALALRELNVDSIPVNFLVPIKGTPLGNRTPLPAAEALRIIAIYRLIMPDKEIRVCGGRDLVLKENNHKIFGAGADGFLIGNYLTTTGRDPEEDLRMIREMGLKVYG